MATNESLVFVNKSIIGPTSVVVGAATFPQTTLQATGTTTLFGNVFVQGGALYPPGPMTAASTALSGYAYGNGTYVASAPEQSGSSSFQVWYAFDNSLTTTTESAGVYATSSPFAYSNTTPYAFSNTIDSGTTTKYNGVWHQLQMPSAIVLEYYTIFPRAGNETSRTPATWRVFGSNDGTSWYTIDAQSSITSWSAPQVSKTFYLSPLPVAYSYFRLSVQNVNGNGGGILDVSQWNLYGKPPVPAMSILGGDLTIRSGGGLNVGPGTLGSNVVIFSNVSGGSNVFVMDSNGRVGIGTTSPGYKLETSGGAIAVTGTNDYLYYAVTNSTASGCYMMFDAQTAGGSGRKYQIGSTGTSNNPGTGCFELFDATAAATRLVVNASGNVGIGTTTSPATTLDVNGTIRTAGNQGTNALILYFLSTPFTQQVSYVNTVDTSLTFSATYIPAAARAVMADVFWSPGLVGGTTVDHQIMNLGSVSNGVQRTWTDGGWGSNPSSYLGTMNNQIVRLLSDGENGGGTAYFIGLRGIWFASKTIPIAANGVMYYSNYGNSGSSGYLYFVVKGYYM